MQREYSFYKEVSKMIGYIGMVLLAVMALFGEYLHYI